MSTLHVKVTAGDIEDGEIGEPTDCPVARAIRRKLNEIGDARSCMVLPDLVEFAGHQITLPDEVTEFIEAFDDGEPVDPLAFDLEIPN